MAKRIVVDADINKRAATELKARGRLAISVSELRLNRSLDPVMLVKLRELYDVNDFALVTADDHMLLEHAVHASGVAVAVIDPWRVPGFTLDQWRRDVVHRWAEKIAAQDAGTWVRYGTRRSAWTKPRRVRVEPTRDDLSHAEVISVERPDHHR